jgi:hypothetical protein
VVEVEQSFPSETFVFLSLHPPGLTNGWIWFVINQCREQWGDGESVTKPISVSSSSHSQCYRGGWFIQLSEHFGWYAATLVAMQKLAIIFQKKKNKGTYSKATRRPTHYNERHACNAQPACIGI